MIDLSKSEGFEWDKGNIEKNWIKHNVNTAEAEEIFFNRPLKIAIIKNKGLFKATRHQALGTTIEGRPLVVVFTIRNRKIRVISARDMSKKERKIYYED
jgi:uncharacterized DUF497 family protein